MNKMDNNWYVNKSTINDAVRDHLTGKKLYLMNSTVKTSNEQVQIKDKILVKYIFLKNVRLFLLIK